MRQSIRIIQHHWHSHRLRLGVVFSDKQILSFAQKCTHLRCARRAAILYPKEKREMMHCWRKSCFGRPEKVCGTLTYCQCTAYTVRTPRKNSRLPGTHEGPSHSLRQADSKNCRNLFNATEPVRVRLQQLQISCPGEPTFRALFPFRLGDALQFPLFPPLTSALSSSLGRSIFSHFPYFLTL